MREQPVQGFSSLPHSDARLETGSVLISGHWGGRGGTFSNMISEQNQCCSIKNALLLPLRIEDVTMLFTAFFVLEHF